MMILSDYGRWCVLYDDWIVLEIQLYRVYAGTFSKTVRMIKSELYMYQSPGNDTYNSVTRSLPSTMSSMGPRCPLGPTLLVQRFPKTTPRLSLNDRHRKHDLHRKNNDRTTVSLPSLATLSRNRME